MTFDPETDPSASSIGSRDDLKSGTSGDEERLPAPPKTPGQRPVAAASTAEPQRYHH